MNREEQVYIKLQQHLDKQPVGFPATRSGVELRILKHIFSPQEARVATCLSYEYEPVETIFQKAKHLVASPRELILILETILKKGGLEAKLKGGQKQYCNTPLVVGMYEFQLNRLTPEFIEDFNEYTTGMRFGLEFLSTKVPQMRTIPIEKSLHPQHEAAPFDTVLALMQKARGPFAIFECICRKKKRLIDEPCQVTDRKETCLAMDEMAQMAIDGDYGRQISRDEAVAIITQNQKEGLVLQPSNSRAAEFICSCCGCCCGMLSVHQTLPKPLDYWATNFYAQVDAQACDGCGVCAKRCQVGAARISEKQDSATIDLNRCLGCGVCLPTCPQNAITLEKKKHEIKPPQTREDLYQIIMDGKKGRLGKLKITGKLLFDAIRTGQTDLLKK